MTPEEYLRLQVHLSDRTKKTYLRCLNRMDLSNVESLAASLELLKKKAAPKTYNLVITALKTTKEAFPQEIREYVEGLKKRKFLNTKHHRPYTPEEVERILKSATGWRKHAVELVLMSGLRQDELRRLNWTDFDFANRTITIIGKGDRKRVIPIAQSDWKCIDRWHKVREMAMENGTLRYDAPQWLFTRKGTRPVLSSGGIWATVSRRAGINVKMHSLRKTYAMRIYERSGHDIMLVRDLLGHSSVETTQIYLNLNDSDLRSRIDRLGGMLK